jgi:hypothetical protein
MNPVDAQICFDEAHYFNSSYLWYTDEIIKKGITFEVVPLF